MQSAETEFQPSYISQAFTLDIDNFSYDILYLKNTYSTFRPRLLASGIKVFLPILPCSFWSSTVPQFSSSHLTTFPGGRTMASNLVLSSRVTMSTKNLERTRFEGFKKAKLVGS